MSMFKQMKNLQSDRPDPELEARILNACLNQGSKFSWPAIRAFGLSLAFGLWLGVDVNQELSIEPETDWNESELLILEEEE